MNTALIAFLEWCSTDWGEWWWNWCELLEVFLWIRNYIGAFVLRNNAMVFLFFCCHLPNSSVLGCVVPFIFDFEPFSYVRFTNTQCNWRIRCTIMEYIVSIGVVALIIWILTTFPRMLFWSYASERVTLDILHRHVKFWGVIFSRWQLQFLIFLNFWMFTFVFKIEWVLISGN